MKKFLPVILILILISVAAGLFFILKTASTSPVKKVSASAEKSRPKAPSASSSKRSKASIPPPPQSALQEEAIQEIRRELQAVMALNKTIQGVQADKTTQMLRIQEQAAIHQKILAGIQQNSENAAPQMPSREALLAQEKLRIIREETLRNKKALEKIQPSNQATS